ncbi:MAG: HAD-IIA family hydrolase [Actinomycetota bacterium]|nr:HAD-IIA family hydrolase [Actinomycetota bacterium]
MTTLRGRYRGFVCDLDGVVYRGPDPVAHAVESLSRPGTHVVYATNNASRPPEQVADHLVRLGLDVGPEQVVTSSQAGARRIASRVAAGSRVLAVGGMGVARALAEAGLEPVTPAQLRDAAGDVAASGPAVAAVLQGYGAGVTADDLAWASYLVADGAWWVATNTDATLPTDRGVAPGNGMLVAAVQRATGVTPATAGKPQGDLYELACDRLGTRQVLGVGDRLDTDILGAMAAGLDSLWVLTGVDDLAALATAQGRPRPTFVAADLRALDHVVPVVSRQGDVWECGGWRVQRDDRGSVHPQVLVVHQDGSESQPDASGDRVPRGLAVLNAGLHLLLASIDQREDGDDLGGPDVGNRGPGAASVEVLVDLARSIEEQAGLREEHRED